MKALLLALATATSAHGFAPPVSLTELRLNAAAAADVVGEPAAEFIEPPVLTPVQAGPIDPINRGFELLGPSGTAGRVRGPDPFGGANGRFETISNDPYLVVLAVHTGYIEGRFTLRRDAANGLDAIGFTGYIRRNNQWGPYQQGESPGQVTYDARSGTGDIRWNVNGQWREDHFRRSGSNNQSLRITLEGNAHEFTPD